PYGHRHDVSSAVFLEPPSTLALHRCVRQHAGRDIHYRCGATIGNEHESSTLFRFSSSVRNLERLLDLLDGPATRDAHGIRTVSLAQERCGRKMLQASSRQSQALHLLRGQWRLQDHIAELQFSSTRLLLRM